MALVITENILQIKDPETGIPYRNMVKVINVNVDDANDDFSITQSNEEEIIRLTHEHYKSLREAKIEAQKRWDRRTPEEKKRWEKIQELIRFE
jgi:hypothetical protein